MKHSMERNLLHQLLPILLVFVFVLAACDETNAATPSETANETPQAASGTAVPNQPGTAEPTRESDANPTEVNATGTVTTTATVTTTTTIDWSGFNFEDDPSGGPKNHVSVNNTKDDRFEAKGNIKLHRLSGDVVQPSNKADAHSSCTDCQSIAVAVQIVLYKRGAQNVSPSNQAVAVNENCLRCVTVALAYQYVIPVDDPREVPRDLDKLVHDLDKEFKYFEQVRSLDDIDPEEAEARLEGIINQYSSLLQYLDAATDHAVFGTPTPTGTVTVTGTTTITMTPVASGTSANTPSASETPVPNATSAATNPPPTAAPAATEAPTAEPTTSSP